MQGAGGIGGFLALTNITGNSYSYFTDGNGNIVDLADACGSSVAHYEYDPFGNLVATSGSLQQSYQWSSKEFDAGMGLVYYLYRYYNPTLGRWTNRDPAEEDVGGVNLYAFDQNQAVEATDPYGLNAYKTGRLAEPSWSRHSVVRKPTFRDYRSLTLAQTELPLIGMFSEPAMTNAFHYLDRTGTPLFWDFGQIIEDEDKGGVSNMETLSNIAQRDFERGTSSGGIKTEINLDLRDAIKYADDHIYSNEYISTAAPKWNQGSMSTEKWFWAFGGIKWAGEGIGQGSATKVRLVMTYSFWDPYQFYNNGKPSGIALKDNDWRALSDSGLATEFLNHGSSNYVVLEWCRHSYRFPKKSELNFTFPVFINLSK